MNFMKKLLLTVALLAVNTSYSSADNSIRSFACYALITSGMYDIISFSHLAQRMEKKEGTDTKLQNQLHRKACAYSWSKERSHLTYYIDGNTASHKTLNTYQEYQKNNRAIDHLSKTAFVTLGLGVTKLYIGCKLL